MAPVVSTDYPFFDVKWQRRSFGLLAFRWDLVTDYAACLAIRGGNLTTRTPLFSVRGRPFIQYGHLQRPKLGAFAPLASRFLPRHQRPQWLPGGVALSRMRTVVWASIALDILPPLVSASNSISQHGFSFHTARIRCQISVYRHHFD